MICATQYGGGDGRWRLMHGSLGRRAAGCKPGGDDDGWQREGLEGEMARVFNVACRVLFAKKR